MDRRPDRRRLLRRPSRGDRVEQGARVERPDSTEWPDSPAWEDVTPQLEAATGRRADGPRRRLWALVLEARGVPCRPGKPYRAAATALLVPPHDADRAVAEVSAYERENPEGAYAQPSSPSRAGVTQTLVVCAALALFHVVVTRTDPTLSTTLGGGGPDWATPWREAGMSDCAAVLGEGQWTRAVTALTLHGDLEHVFGNALFGGVFFFLYTRRVGGGLGWWTILASGAVGNLLNCALSGSDHLSLGASTAVFGAVGALAGAVAVEAAKRRVANGSGLARVKAAVRGAFVPLAMGVGFLAFLGAGEGRVDLGAHLLGFVVGMAPGAVCGWVALRGWAPGGHANAMLTALAAAAVGACWFVRLGAA